MARFRREIPVGTGDDAHVDALDSASPHLPEEKSS